MTVRCLIALALLAGEAAAGAGAAEIEPGFRPVLEKVSLAPARVRPGDTLGFTLYFRNRGKNPTEREYSVFVHFEDEQDCEHIQFQLDHSPSVPTTDWPPGELIADGPHGVEVPVGLPDGEYFLHVGVFRREAVGERLYETYWAGKVVVDSAAPTGQRTLKALAPQALARRRKAQATRLDDVLTVSSPHIELRVSRRTGAFQVLDKATGVLWGSSPWREALCEYSVRGPKQARRIVANRFAAIEREGDSVRLVSVPEVNGKRLPLSVTFRLRLLPGGRAIRFSYEADGKDGWRVASVKLLDSALWTTNEDQGYVVTPTLIGRLWPADSGEMFTRRLRTFAWGQLHMQMAGVVRQGSAALVSWQDPYVDLELRSHVGDWPTIPGRQLLSLSLHLAQSAKACRIDFLGRGGYVEIAKAYRRLAEQAGYAKTWREKLEKNADAAKVFGAPIIKPFVMMGVPPQSGLKPRVSFTFDEAAQVAEHLKRDVGIEKALFVLAGWLHRGYDSQHPDILPAAPECGGTAALADCARRVKALGYLFGLHDNYQDLYPDAPSWNERYLMRHRDGSIRKGGKWAGGQCWLINSKMGLELAQRPQNLPSVKRLFGPTAYFTDTTFAAPLLEDFSKDHPLTRHDDLRWKRALADYCVEQFGFHGSEMGYEWAIAHSHYFEGLLSRERFAHILKGPGRIVPLFELVYRDCIALYTHQGDRAGPGSARYILFHLGLGRMPLYRFGSHLYWKNDAPAGTTPAVASVRVRSMRLVAPGIVEATYEWRALRGIKEKVRVFVHFGKSDSRIRFQNDHELARPTSSWKKGEAIVDGPHRFDLPEHARGAYEIRLGLFVPGGQRLPVAGQAADGRVFAGRLSVSLHAVRFLPAEPRERMPTACFAQVHGGFAAKMGATDAFIRNTYEFLSPLNELTAAVPMTGHRFLTPDGKVELTRFGKNTTVVINGSAKSYIHEGTTLPPFGFIVQSPTFVAFHALNWQGVRYKRPALFAIRSLDGQPLERSERIRVYHAFGSPKLAFRTERKSAVAGGRTSLRRDDGRLIVEVPGLEIIELK